MDNQTVTAQGAFGASLTVRQGEQEGSVFTLSEQPAIIGREDTADITIGDPEMSRRHAKVVFQAGKYVIEDLGSTNGTILNGTKVTDPRTLASGDTIKIGQTVLEYQEQMLPTPAPVQQAPAPVAPSGAEIPPPPQPAAPVAPTAPAAPEAPPKKKRGCWLWGCGCLALAVIGLILLVVIVAFLLPQMAPDATQNLQDILDGMGIPVQLSFHYVADFLV